MTDVFRERFHNNLFYFIPLGFSGCSDDFCDNFKYIDLFENRNNITRIIQNSIFMNLEETNMKRFLMLSALLSLGLILGACGQSSSTEADHKNKAEETKTEQKANKEQKAKEDQNDQKRIKSAKKPQATGKRLQFQK